MKRILVLLLALMLLMTLAGCTGAGDAASTTTAATTTTATYTAATSTTVTTTEGTTQTALPTTVTTTAPTASKTTKRATTTTVVTTKAAVTTKTTAAPTTAKATTVKATTTTTVKTTAAPTGSTEVYAIGEYMTKLINKERADAGVAPLTHRVDLQRYADIRVEEIKQSFSHTRPDGTSCFTVFDEDHFWAMGENIAMGQRTVDEVMEDWMNSPGHRSNILSSDFNGVIIGFDDYHWVQLFVYE